MNNLMRQFAGQLLIACCILLCRPAGAEPIRFSFAVITSPVKAATDENALRNAIAETDADNLAFVVANGIKSLNEPCTDSLYKRRKALFDSSKNGLIVSLAGSDWTECKNSQGRTDAVERLSRLRELFFIDEFSMGQSRIPVFRYSLIAKFHSYSENMRWDIGNVTFATMNLPAENNHYRPEAGRNSEFEDRLIANRNWLHRIFKLAAYKKMAGIVLFCDGDPLAVPKSSYLFSSTSKRDGFAEMRRYIRALSAKFPGKVLIVHKYLNDQTPTAGNIVWNKNVGELGLNPGWIKIQVIPDSPTVFSVNSETIEAAEPQQ
jgi:hypothetical protein